MSLVGNWKLYYKVKFELFLVKNRIILNNREKEIIIIEDNDSYVKWEKVEHCDQYEDVDFQRYVGKNNSH